MLRLHPDKRATAGELVHHKWLEGVVVQGEIDMIRQAEEEDLRRRAAAAQAQHQQAQGAAPLVRTLTVGAEGRAKLRAAEERHHIEEMHDADALKPVEVLQSDDPPESSGSVLPGPGAGHGVVNVPGAGLGGGLVTSSAAQKENVGQHTASQHGRGHRPTGSRGTNPTVRIETGGLTGKKRD